MDDILKQDILEMITPELLFRARRIYIADSEYKEAARKADLIYDKVASRLDDGLARSLDEYLTANNATIAVQEKLVYQQGMRDLLDLLVALLKGGGHDAH